MEEEEYDVYLSRRNRLARFITGKPQWRVAVEYEHIKQSADSDTVKGAWISVCAGLDLFQGITISSPCPWDENGARITRTPDIAN